MMYHITASILREVQLELMGAYYYALQFHLYKPQQIRYAELYQHASIIIEEKG